MQCHTILCYTILAGELLRQPLSRHESMLAVESAALGVTTAALGWLFRPEQGHADPAHAVSHVCHYSFSKQWLTWLKQDVLQRWQLAIHDGTDMAVGHACNGLRETDSRPHVADNRPSTCHCHAKVASFLGSLREPLCLLYKWAWKS
jgi:hypothetical protein